MPAFLVQSYVADPAQAVVAMGTARLGGPAGAGPGARLAQAILIPEDEVMLTLWSGTDREAVCQATRDLGLAPDRVSAAQDLLGRGTVG